ncbi:MAG: hypothetical protein Q7U96_05960, partial [Chloroflexota bacterium]|nr:hypothetical protein [Chloroflexota bacterium]
ARMNGLNGQDVISIPQFNARLPALAASKPQANSPILVVDMYTNFFVDVHTVDGVHPNGNGEQKMANRWLAGINQLTKVVLSKRFFIPLVTK